MNYYKNKTVLVTGATGLIGSHIIDRLMQEANIKVIALSRSEDKLKKGFASYLNNPNFSYIAQDVSSSFNLDDTIDIIFHAAGPMEGKIIANYPISVILPNIQGTINCLEFIRKQKEQKNKSCRLVLFSSVTVYGNGTNQDKTVNENDTNYTLNTLEAVGACYSESKRMSEVIAHSYNKQYGIDVVIARFSTVYGKTRFIPDTAFFEFIKKSIKREDIVLNSKTFARRDNIYIDDAVRGVLLVGSNGISNEAYNISSNGELENFAGIDEIANVIVKTSNQIFNDNKDITVTTQSRERVSGLKLNNTKLKKLGWEVEVSLQDGIETIIKEMAG